MFKILTIEMEKANALNLNTPEEPMGRKVASGVIDSEADNLKSLTSEFRGLHEQRLAFLDMDASIISREDVHQKKVDLLQCYVNDLADQNQVLIQTIEDLQNETDPKLGLNQNLSTTNFSYDALSCFHGQKVQISAISQGLTLHAVFAEELKPLSLDELVGPTAPKPYSCCSLADITSKLEDLKVQLQTKDIVIYDLEMKLGDNLEQSKKEAILLSENSERLVHLRTELSCLQQIQKDNIKEIAEKDFCITKLKANIEMLQQDEADKDTQLKLLHVKVKELQEDVKTKEEGWRKHQEEQRLTYEKELWMAKERNRHEQQERGKEARKQEEEWKRAFQEERKAHNQMVKKAATLSSELEVCRKQVLQQSRALSEFQQKEETLLIQMKAQEERVKHLDQDVVGLQTTQDSLKRTLAMKEKHAQQLAHDNTQLKDSLAALQSKLQVSECMVSDISKSLDKAQSSVEKERLEKQQIQDQLLSTKKEVECLQQELTHLRLSSEKKIQKREIKICALVKDLSASKRQQSECQTQLLSKEKALDKLCDERDELKAKMEDRHMEYIHLNHTKEQLEVDLALSHEKLHTSHLEVKSRDQLILQLRGEMKTAEKKHQTALEQMEALEDEVRRLNQKVKGHQEEACQLSEKVSSIERLKDQEEKELQQLQDQLCISHHQLETSEEKLKKQWREIDLLHQQLKETKEQLREASLQAQSQNETTAIFKQKYTAAIEKVHRVQGQVDVLEEELRYSKQQLKESQVAKQSVKHELVEMEQRYQEKVGQWENSQEALDQLTDELQSCQKLLRESQQKMEDQKNLIGSLQDQENTLKQQKLETESAFKHYQQSHSYSDDEYLSQLKQRQQLQKRCTEQVEHLAECEKAILQMKSELERQAQEKTDLQKNLVVLEHGHLKSRRQQVQEAARLKKEVTRLELELTDAQKVHVSLLRSEGDLREARHQAEKKSQELDLHKEEVLRLQEELQKEQETKSNALREKRRLKAYIRQLSQELEELRSKHQVTVEELAARAEEAKRMEGCLNKEKLAEEKIRLVMLRLETELTELKRNLEEAVDQKLKAEKEKQEAEDQMGSLWSELEVIRSDNANLRHESQLVMTNVNQWITQQKAANENIAVQMKAQSKVLRIVTEEKEHLQEANNTLKADLKRLKEVADEKEQDMEHLKAQFQDHRCWRHDRTAERETCVASNLSKIEDMQTRLRSNLEAVQKLNQQLNILSRENKHLHRQLEEERSLRRQVEPLCLSPPISVHPLPVSTSLPSYRHFLPP